MNSEENVEFARLFHALGETQSAVAERIGIKQSAISQYLSGNAKPRPIVMQATRLEHEKSLRQPESGAGVLLNDASSDSNPIRQNPKHFKLAKELYADLNEIEEDKREEVIRALSAVVKAFPKKSSGYRSAKKLT